MSVFSSEELDLFERSVARFVTEDYSAERRRRAIAAGDFDRTAWSTYADLGWLGLGIAAESGGAGGGLADLLTIFYAAGRGLLLEPLLPTLVVGAGLVSRLAAPGQAEDLLARIADGRLALAFASGSTGSQELTSAQTPDGKGFLVSGVARTVVHGAAVDSIVAVTQDTLSGGPRVLLLAPGAPGVVLSRYRMIDDLEAADLDCSGVFVGREDCLDGDDTGAALEQVLAAAAIASAAESVGAMEALNQITLEYVKVRKQFGRPLGNFQVLQHRLVDMMIAARQARAIVNRAAAVFDAGAPEAVRLASAAKLIAGRAGRFVGEQSIQVHGGIGMTEEYAAGHYFKRLLRLGADFGDADDHLRRLAATLHGTKTC